MNLPIYLSFTAFGFFAIDENGKVVLEHLTYPDTEISAQGIAEINQETPTERLTVVAGQLGSTDAEEIIVDSQSLGRALSQVISIPVRVQEDCSVTKLFRETLDSFLIESKIVESVETISSFRRDVAIRLAKVTISSASEEKDILIKHAIDAIDEIDKAINVVTMRVREWYSIHHPSLGIVIEDQEKFVRIVEKCGGRASTKQDCLQSIDLTESVIQAIMENLEQDIGAEWQDSDLTIVRSFAKNVVEQYEVRKELEEYVTSLMESVAPNISALVGAIVGARLISLAGSLRDLARKPSSTIQVYGAEKALFRALKTGTDPPKHGIIYQVAEIHTAPYWQRGKIARALAGKIAIAARIDAYSKRDVGDTLRKSFEKRVEEIRKQNPKAPPPRPPKPKPKKQERKHKGKSGHKRKRGGKR